MDSELGLRPGYTRLMVRCCCKPEKILGTLDLKSEYVNGETTLHFPVAPPDYIEKALANEPVEFGQVGIQLRLFTDYTSGTKVQTLAVYSDDHPLEFWKRFKTFVPWRQDG